MYSLILIQLLGNNYFQNICMMTSITSEHKMIQIEACKEVACYNCLSFCTGNFSLQDHSLCVFSNYCNCKQYDNIGIEFASQL